MNDEPPKDRIDRRVAMTIGLHGAKGEPALSITEPGKKVTRIVRGKPKKPTPPK